MGHGRGRELTITVRGDGTRGHGGNSVVFFIMEQLLVKEFAILIANALKKYYTVTIVQSNHSNQGMPEAEFDVHVGSYLVIITVMYHQNDYYVIATANKGSNRFNGLPYSKTLDLIDPDCFEKMAELLRRKIHE